MSDWKILQILADEYACRMLMALKYDELSARDLSHNLYIPLATVYRKISELEAEGFIKCAGKSLTQDGKRYKIYKSQVININAIFDGGSIEVGLHLSYEQPRNIKIKL